MFLTGHKTVYRGTLRSITKTYNLINYMFFSTRYKFAEILADIHNEDPIVLKYKLRKGLKIFNPYSSKEFLLLSTILPKEWKPTYTLVPQTENIDTVKLIEIQNTRNNWRIMECDEVINILKNNGYDGHLCYEEDVQNYCLYEPKNNDAKLISIITEDYV